jgi:hypothetical protein
MELYLSTSHLDFKKGQDRSDAKHMHSDNAIIAIADGIASVPYSELAAEALVDQITSNSCFEETDLNITNAFHILRKHLVQEEIKGATTFILGRADNEKISLGWCGNGCILHLKGQFWKKGEWIYPYALSNHLIPHIDENGALFKYLSSDCSIEQATPSRLDLFWDYCGSGDILIIASDGFGSSEELPVGYDSNNLIWEEKPKIWGFLFEQLHKFLCENSMPKIPFQDALVQFNKDVIKEMKDKDLLEDDIAIGIIITEQVLEYYQKEWKNESYNRQDSRPLLLN